MVSQCQSKPVPCTKCLFYYTPAVSEALFCNTTQVMILRKAGHWTSMLYQSIKTMSCLPILKTSTHQDLTYFYSLVILISFHSTNKAVDLAFDWSHKLISLRINVNLQMPLKPYTYLGFGIGPRMCPGMNLAKLEICIFIHHLVCRYKYNTLHIHRNVLVQIDFTYADWKHCFNYRWKPLEKDDSLHPTLVRMPRNKYPIVVEPFWNVCNRNRNRENKQPKLIAMYRKHTFQWTILHNTKAEQFSSVWVTNTENGS